MRRRITFLHRSEDAFAPSQLRTEKKALQVSDLKAAREDRFTFGFEDIPQEVCAPLAPLSCKAKSCSCGLFLSNVMNYT